MHPSYHPESEARNLLEENRVLREQVSTLTKERDAYRKAKAENDERFMQERDVTRQERDAAVALLAKVHATLGRRDSHGPEGDAAFLLDTLASVMRASRENSLAEGVATERAEKAERALEAARALARGWHLFARVITVGVDWKERLARESDRALVRAIRVCEAHSEKARKERSAAERAGAGARRSKAHSAHQTAKHLAAALTSLRSPQNVKDPVHE
jgi:hypothetical protein